MWMLTHKSQDSIMKWSNIWKKLLKWWNWWIRVSPFFVLIEASRLQKNKPLVRCKLSELRDSVNKKVEWVCEWLFTQLCLSPQSYLWIYLWSLSWWVSKCKWRQREKLTPFHEVRGKGSQFFLYYASNGAWISISQYWLIQSKNKKYCIA